LREVVHHVIDDERLASQRQCEGGGGQRRPDDGLTKAELERLAGDVLGHYRAVAGVADAGPEEGDDARSVDARGARRNGGRGLLAAEYLPPRALEVVERRPRRAQSGRVDPEHAVGGHQPAEDVVAAVDVAAPVAA